MFTVLSTEILIGETCTDSKEGPIPDGVGVDVGVGVGVGVAPRTVTVPVIDS